MTDTKMLRIRLSTYKQLKQLALDKECTLIALIDLLLSEYLKQKANAD